MNFSGANIFIIQNCGFELQKKLQILEEECENLYLNGTYGRNGNSMDLR